MKGVVSDSWQIGVAVNAAPPAVSQNGLSEERCELLDKITYFNTEGVERNTVLQAS
jgi:hypothetical protein